MVSIPVTAINPQRSNRSSFEGTRSTFDARDSMIALLMSLFVGDMVLTPRPGVSGQICVAGTDT
ncbi:hypothetical protein, partial [Nonomuraea angiospora]